MGVDVCMALEKGKSLNYGNGMNWGKEPDSKNIPKEMIQEKKLPVPDPIPSSTESVPVSSNDPPIEFGFKKKVPQSNASDSSHLVSKEKPVVEDEDEELSSPVSLSSLIGIGIALFFMIQIVPTLMSVTGNTALSGTTNVIYSTFIPLLGLMLPAVAIVVVIQVLFPGRLSRV